MASGPVHGPAAAITRHVPLHFYPAYCNKASPTYFSWVKLTAADIHHLLRSRPGFASHSSHISHHRPQNPPTPSLLFYQNHPIQFVCVVGVVVALDDHEFVWVFTVDDSSGETIDVAYRKPDKVTEPDKDKSEKGRDTIIAGQETTVSTRTRLKNGTPHEADTRAEIMSRIDVGVIVKVKGTIRTFRSTRQIALERLEIVPDTNAEVRFWAQRTQLFVDVLSKPWELSTEEQARLLTEAEGEVEKRKQRATRRDEHAAKERRREKRHAEKIRKAEEAEERKRVRVAEEMRQHGLKVRIHAVEKEATEEEDEDADKEREEQHEAAR